MARRDTGGRRRGMTLLEFLIVVAVVGVLFFITVPTLRQTEGEASIDFAKEQLHYLYNKQQIYYTRYGTYVPLSKLATDVDLGRTYDQRFAEDTSTVNDIVFEGPNYEAAFFEITATLPDGDKYRIDATGKVKRISTVE